MWLKWVLCTFGRIGQKNKNCKVSLTSARLGGRFNHSSKQYVMKCKEAISGPDDKELKEVKKENKWIIKHKVWRSIKRNQVLMGINIRFCIIHEEKSRWSLMRQVESTWMQSARWKTLWQFFDLCPCDKWHDDLHYVDIDVNLWLKNMSYWCEGCFLAWMSSRWQKIYI